MSVLDPAATALSLFDAERNLHFFPIRHHSPACALQLGDDGNPALRRPLPRRTGCAGVDEHDASGGGRDVQPQVLG